MLSYFGKKEKKHKYNIYLSELEDLNSDVGYKYNFVQYPGHC